MRAIAGFLLIALFATGCAAPTATPEAVCQAATEAIADGDWERYRELTITMADFDLRQSDISATAAPQSYAGGVLKPELVEKQRQQFRMAVAELRGKAAIFQSMHASAGQLELESLTGASYLAWTYLADVGLKSRLAFTLTKWGDEYRILGVRVSP